MDPRIDDLYAGIAGVETELDEFDLGYGVTIKRAYAHFMAPFMVSCTPPGPGAEHGEPWCGVKGGFEIDIRLEVHVPSTFDVTGFFDRLNTIWWITALIRLKGAFAAHVPVIADRPFQEIPQNWEKATVLPIEALPRHIFVEPTLLRLSKTDFDWLKSTWIDGGKMMRKSRTFYDAFQALDAAGALPSRSVALLAIWGALEHLFSPAKQELRFRVSANIAAYLESPGQSRLELHRRLMKLYDARSEVAHGTRMKSTDAWPETHQIANRILMKIFSSRCVPTKDDLELKLFSAEVAP